jgi:hypothetical protein
LMNSLVKLLSDSSAAFMYSCSCTSFPLSMSETTVWRFSMHACIINV